MLVISSLCLFAAAVPSSAVDLVDLEKPSLHDSYHGVQFLDDQKPAAIGLPAELIGEFVFQLPAGTPQPRLDARWRITTPSGDAVAIRADKSIDGTLVPTEWYGDLLPESPVTVIRYRQSTGSGRARLTIPINRTVTGQQFPSFNHERGLIEVRVGHSGVLSSGAMGMDPSGAELSCTADFAVTTPQVLVDVARPTASLVENVAAGIVTKDPVGYDRTFSLKCSVSGILAGLPGTVVLPANETVCQVVYGATRDGIYQIEVYDESMELVGQSTLCEFNSAVSAHLEGFDRDSTAVVFTEEREPLGLLPSFTTDLNEEEYVAFEVGTYEDADYDPLSMMWWQYVCHPARYFGGNNAKKCGECAETPLDESDSPDCPDHIVFFMRHSCEAVAWDPLTGPGTDCVPANIVLELDAFVWTGGVWEAKCTSADFSFGWKYLAVASGLTDTRRECCAYRNLEVKGEYLVPSCETVIMSH